MAPVCKGQNSHRGGRGAPPPVPLQQLPQQNHRSGSLVVSNEKIGVKTTDCTARFRKEHRIPEKYVLTTAHPDSGRSILRKQSCITCKCSALTVAVTALVCCPWSMYMRDVTAAQLFTQSDHVTPVALPSLADHSEPRPERQQKITR